MPVMSLRDAIEESINLPPPNSGSEVFVTLSMHDAEGPVLYGKARPIFVADLPPRGTTATIGGGSSSTGIGSWFAKQPTPGYTSRNSPYGYGQEDFYLSSQKFDAGYQQPFVSNKRVAMDFSVRRDPGTPFFRWLRGGPTVQIEIEVGPTAVTLDAAEDGLYLRAVGPSIEDPNHRAIYTVSLDWMPIIL